MPINIDHSQAKRPVGRPRKDIKKIIPMRSFRVSEKEWSDWKSAAPDGDLSAYIRDTMNRRTKRRR